MALVPTYNTLPQKIKFVELDNIELSQVPETSGQFIITDKGLYYDHATLRKRLRMGGTTFAYSDSFGEKLVPDSNEDGVIDATDVAAAAQGEGLNEGDLYTFGQYVSDDSDRLVVTTNMKASDGTMKTIASPAALSNQTYFEENIKITEPVGNVTIPSTGFRELEIAGLSVTEVFKKLFQVANNNPTISAGSLAVTLNVYNTAGATGTRTVNTSSTSVSVEQGTPLVGFSATCAFTKPTYQFGPSPSQVRVVSGTTELEGTSAAMTNLADTTTSASYTTTQKRDLTGGVATTSNPITFKVSIQTSDGAVAYNNLGDTTAPAKKYTGTTLSRTVTINGYQMGKFYGGLAANVEGSALTSAQIRSLTKSNAAWSTSSVTFTVPAGTYIVVIAIPKGKTIKQIKNITAGFDDVKGDFTKRTMAVGGYNNNMSHSSEYDVFYYKPSTGAYVNATQFQVYFN